MDPTRVLLYVMVCVGLHQSFANSCEIYRFEDEQNKAFENHVIKTMTTSMKELCQGACVRLHKCFSINVRPSKFLGFVECDLNNSSKKASPGSLVTRAESEYHQMGKVDERNRKNYIEVIKADLGNDWYRYGDAALKVFKDLKTWSEARTHCQSLGGDLASISSENHNHFIYDVFLKDINNQTRGLIQAIAQFLAHVAWAAVAHVVDAAGRGVESVAALCYCQLMATGWAVHLLYALGDQRTLVALGVLPQGGSRGRLLWVEMSSAVRHCCRTGLMLSAVEV
ncbi:hypothetical protein QZH41_006442 [Actinostola sp. cb2023]|nr:hypothetical protein QZH41_006442 [Actinostola sp. cb2023]